jgi:2-(1,2-epoxy-1,2-dihydrophenyl)acetyl-CoA isomerase
MSADLVHQIRDGVSWITLNRPEAGNAITPQQRDAIIGLLRTASDDPLVRCVVIGANGKHFCTGADLRIRRPTDEGNAPPTTIMKTIANGAQVLVAAIMDCHKPVIASVGGTAAGIGAHLALACDLVVAADSASFIEVFVRRGLCPDGGGAYLLPRLIGLRRAAELIMLGDRVTAAEAKAMGLVNRVVPAAELDGAVRDLAARLGDAPTIAIGLAKRLLNSSLDVPRDTAFLAESMSQELITGTDDAAEGIASFVERRDPRFVGR